MLPLTTLVSAPLRRLASFQPPWRRMGATFALVAAVWFVVRPERMWVEHVDFVGNVRAVDGELRHLANLRNGTRWWEVDVDGVARGVEAHPWVKSARAWRVFPSTVVVQVEEHAPVAMVSWKDDLFYVDREGTPFLRAHADDLNHPIISGLTPELGRRNTAIPWLVLHDALWLLDELDARRLIPRDHVSEVSFMPSRGFTLQTTGASLGKPTTRVLIAPGDYERQLQHLSQVLHSGVALTDPLHVDVGAFRTAIVRRRDGRDIQLPGALRSGGMVEGPAGIDAGLVGGATRAEAAAKPAPAEASPTPHAAPPKSDAPAQP